MQYIYKYKFVRMAPRKVRLITELVKSMSITDALNELKYSNKSAAIPVSELINSAYVSLKTKNIQIENITIVSLTCDQGPSLKRRRYKSRGRAVGIKKRLSHITLVLSTKDKPKKAIKKVAKKENHGTKSQSKKS